MTIEPGYDPQADPRTLDELMASLRGIQLYMLRMDMPHKVEDPLQYLMPHLREHALWLEDREKAGVLFLSGANRSPEEWDGSGTAILRADSLETARRIAETEPFHREGLRTNTVHGWLLNEGSLNLRISLFTDTVGLS